MKDYAVVVPAYNEQKRIGNVLDTLVATKLPIYVVDDGSRDKTFEVVKQYKVIALRHRINLGKGAALKTGTEAAFADGYQAIIMMDSDGQHKVEDLPKFTEALDKGCEVVIGSRNLNLRVPFIRLLGNKCASALVSLLFGIYVSDLLCGYRAFTKKAYEKIEWQSTGYGVETEMVVRVGLSKLHYCEVPVETVYFDKFKGVTILDAFGILVNVVKWRIFK